MDNTETLLLLGHALGMTPDEQEYIVSDMADKVPIDKKPFELIEIFIDGMDTTSVYTGALLYAWLLDTYGNKGEGL